MENFSKEIQIIERHQNIAELRKETPIFQKKYRPKNNRKATKGRKVQKIVIGDFSVFPPIFKHKFIKHY